MKNFLIIPCAFIALFVSLVASESSVSDKVTVEDGDDDTVVVEGKTRRTFTGGDEDFPGTIIFPSTK